MDLYGNILIPATYDYIQEEDSVYQVIANGIMSIMDYSFNVINPFVCSDISDVVYYPNGIYEDGICSKDFLTYSVGQQQGIMDIHGNIIIPAIYDGVFMVSEHLFKARKSYQDAWVLFDTQGNMINPQ